MNDSAKTVLNVLDKALKPPWKHHRIKLANERIKELEAALGIENPFSTFAIGKANDEITRLESLLAKSSSSSSEPPAPRVISLPARETASAAAPPVSTTTRTQPASHTRTHEVIRSAGNGDVKRALSIMRGTLDHLAGAGASSRVLAGREDDSDFEQLRLVTGAVDQAGAAKAKETAAAKEKAANFQPPGGLSLSALEFLNQGIFGGTRQIAQEFPEPEARYERLLKNFAAAGYSWPGMPRGLSTADVSVAWRPASQQTKAQEIINTFVDELTNGESSTQRNSVGARWAAQFKSQS